MELLHAVGALDWKHVALKELWCPVRQLQGILFYCHVVPGRWRVQSQMGGHGHSWFLFRYSYFQDMAYENLWKEDSDQMKELPITEYPWAEKWLRMHLGLWHPDSGCF